VIIGRNAEENKKNIAGSRVAVLGAARSGIAVSKLIAREGASVLLSDVKPADMLSLDRQELERLGIELETGGHSDRILQSDLICISPGLPLDIPVLGRAQKKAIPIVGEIEVSSWFCHSPIFAITGSNGKTTTTTLSGEILKKWDPSTIVAGNIGVPFSEHVLNCSSKHVVILEISSFQLETIYSFHPRIAVIMNLTPNHLDRYPDFEAYAQAKMNILKNMTESDYLIYNIDDNYLKKSLRKAIPKKLVFSLQPHSREGVYWVNEKIIIRLAGEEEHVYLKNIYLRGPHNRYNMMVAALIASLQEVPEKIIAKELCKFKGIEHRLELVRVLNHVTFINDSKATSVDSLSYALKSFDDKIILIAGGKDKGGDFSKINHLLKDRVKTAILIGQAADRMEKAWQGIVPLLRADNLQDAIRKAFQVARKNEIVLLSPACSSFDMFRDYEDRGRQFKKIVENLD